MIKDRVDTFIDELPKNKGVVMTSAVKAGYSKAYARTRQKTIMKTALKRQVSRVQDALQNKEIARTEVKRLMSEIVGLKPEQLMKRLAFIANQDKDLSSALKVLAPLVREHGVILSTDDDNQNVTVPIINLGFSNTQNVAKNIDPVLEHITPETPNLNEGSVEP